MAEPDAISINTTSISTSCYGTCDGSAVAVVSGGTTPYNYTWSHGGSSAIESNLCAGNYSIAIIDANNCLASNFATVDTPDELIATITTNPASGAISADGSAIASTTGGTVPYNYIWSNSEVGESITDIVPGEYCVTVTDNNGCSAAFCDSVGYTVSVFEETIFSSYEVYPNPVKNNLTIETNGLKVSSLEIVDILGKTVINKTTNLPLNKIDMTTLNSGIYFVRINSDKGTFIEKVTLTKY